MPNPHSSRPRTIAITGGIAEGKTTVLNYCRDAGYAVASADDAAREVFRFEQVQNFLQQRLGTADRDRVRQAVAENPVIRRELNAITHPAILQQLQQTSAQVVEVPLLIETCLQAQFDRIWVVTCGRQEQLRRLGARIGDAEARRLLRSQLPTSAKTPFADLIVRTNQPESDVHSYVLEKVAAELQIQQ